MPLIDELGLHVPRELDFVNEGHNAEIVAKYFEDRDDIAIPEVHWKLTTRRVLEADFVDGIKVTDVGALRAAGIDPARVVQILAEVYCEQVFNRGFFHADPHPGNILVQRAPSGGPRVVLVDFGLAKQLPAYFREGVLAFAGALLRGDPDAMAEALLELGFETRDGRPESLAEIAGFVLDAALQLRTQSHMTRRVGRELAEKIRANPIVRIPGHIVLLARVLALLSGVGRSLEVKLDLVATLLPYALKR
jgi:ubiquinone biosynthesis protein